MSKSAKKVLFFIEGIFSFGFEAIAYDESDENEFQKGISNLFSKVTFLKLKGNCKPIRIHYLR